MPIHLNLNPNILLYFIRTLYYPYANIYNVLGFPLTIYRLIKL